MLRPLITSFINFHYIDLLPLSVGIEVFIFLYEFYYAHTKWWHFLIQALISVEVAFVARIPQGRQGKMFAIVPRVLDPSVLPQILCVALLCLPLALYENRIHDPMNSLQSTFYIGAVFSVLGIGVAIGLIEGIGYFFKQPSCNFRLLGQHRTCFSVVLLLVIFDGLVFLNAYRFVLATIGWVLGAAVLGIVFNYALSQ